MFKKLHLIYIKKRSLLLALLGFAVCLAAIILSVGILSKDKDCTADPASGAYVILGMNDLGMHCYQQDYSGFLILPPGNNLKIQVIKNEGDKAKLVNSGIKVSYELIGNTDSASHTNFWTYAKYYGYNIPKNIGITGNGLQGVFALSSDGKYYEATAIPVTPYNDGSDKLNPYQLARITVTDSATGKVLAKTSDLVVPVSDEMLCSACHGSENTSLNILKAHDELSKTTLAKDLEQGKRYKCSECHLDNAMNEKGKADVLPLSEALHGFHAGRMAQSDITPVCYNCHPGPVTQCNRGRMYVAGLSCDDTNCHGDMANVAETQANGRQGWLQEPDCAACHGPLYGVNANTLYRNSYLMNAPGEEMNGLILCESCHNSPHAEWPSSQPKDNLLPVSLQGFEGFIKKCSVCHEGAGRVHNKPG